MEGTAHGAFALGLVQFQRENGPRADYWLNACGWRAVTAFPVVEPEERIDSSGSRTSEASLIGEFVEVPSK